MGSSMLLKDPRKQSVVGLQLNAVHISKGKKGDFILARGVPVKVGRNVHVWNIEVFSGDVVNNRVEPRNLLCKVEFIAAVQERAPPRSKL